MPRFIIIISGTIRILLVGILLIQIAPNLLRAQAHRKVAIATRVTNPPVIDGILDDVCWSMASANDGFYQFEPDYGQPESQVTLVYFVYDHQAIYVGAFLFDRSPDSILRQLGRRDDNSINSDWFMVYFDTYNNQSDAYAFRVSASGVQSDWRISDRSFDAVWLSAVSISPVGWSVEMKIPFTAFLFPDTDEQEWGLQIQRSVRRYRELSEWSITPKDISNSLAAWGTLVGIKNIKPPPGISLTPYLYNSLLLEEKSAEKSLSLSDAYGGGTDLRYVIGHSFTLDMMLYPDFSEVRSDEKVKNLTPFETVYGEHRPFFRQSVDLFRKGGLFYSRRIGGQPQGYYQVAGQIDSTESILKNPVQSRIVNAIKLSGRNSKGLAIGFLNVITGNTYAVIQNESNEKRKILTNPLTNYNITVADYILPHNSSVYLINTSVIRDKQNPDANVTGAGFQLHDPGQIFRINFNGAVSQRFTYEPLKGSYIRTPGYKYSLSAGKVSGKLRFGISRNVMNNQYNDNDLGLTHRNDYEQHNLQVSYFLFEPVGQIRSFRGYAGLSREISFTTRKNINTVLSTGYNLTSLKYNSHWLNISYSPLERYDYYDPRTKGRYYIRPSYAAANGGFSTDYRKTVAFDGNLWLSVDAENSRSASFNIQPRWRVNDKLNLTYSFSASNTKNNRGWVKNLSDGIIIYGNRNLKSFENTISGQYIFSNNLSLGIWMRQYWYYGIYSSYYTLLSNGRLIPNEEYHQNNDFSFNSVDVNLVFQWDFAPGSQLSLVWKNSVSGEENQITPSFLDNFFRTLQYDQTNQITVKLNYYIDYQSFIKIKPG